MGEKRVAIDTILQPKKKCAKRRFVGDDVDDDRISQLPDEILADILSLLSINEAARTSVLSSRWINLWKHTTSLNFNAESALQKIRKQREMRHELLESERGKYVKWVNSVIQSHESLTLKEFKLRFHLDRSSSKTITRWLEFAFSRRVQRLELDFLGDCVTSKYCFPKEFFAPKSDTVCIDRPRMLDIGFKSLKTLVFKSVHVTGGAIDFFLHNCPLLEQLIVRNSWKKLSKIEVSGPSLRLKHFELVYCSRLESLKVSAPSLTTLTVTRLKELLLENVPKLVDLTVSCGDDDTSIQHLFGVVLSCCISQLHTLRLILDSKYFGRHMDEMCDLPIMPKLKKLSIEYCARGDESLIRLVALIRVSPCLEEFELKFIWRELPREDREMKDAVRIPHRHLKVFKFIGYYGGTNDVELFSYILENSVVLEKIIIHPYWSGVPDRLEVERTTWKTAKEKLAPQVPQHIELVIL